MNEKLSEWMNVAAWKLRYANELAKSYLGATLKFRGGTYFEFNVTNYRMYKKVSEWMNVAAWHKLWYANEPARSYVRTMLNFRGGTCFTLYLTNERKKE